MCKDRLNRCIQLLITHQDDFVDALNTDFGARSKDMSRFTDIVAAIAPRRATVRGEFNTRGGISARVTASYPSER